MVDEVPFQDRTEMLGGNFIGFLLQFLSRVRLCNALDSSPPSSSVHGISQARILEWVAFSFSRPRDGTGVSFIARV